MKKILTAFFYLLVLLILVFNIFSYFKKPFFGFMMFKVGSGSMEPYLDVNDIILIKASDDYNVNDVVTYIKNNEFITHRIIFIVDDTVVTKGDANNTEDEAINKSSIVGKQVLKFKFLGYLLSLKYSLIWIFVLGLIITILIPDKKSKVVRSQEYGEEEIKKKT